MLGEQAATTPTYFDGRRRQISPDYKRCNTDLGGQVSHDNITKYEQLLRLWLSVLRSDGN
jgi:hypothetical protein